MEEIWRVRLEAEDNLDQLQNRIRLAKFSAQQLGGQYSPQDQFIDQTAVRYQQSVAELARAQERAALSGMNHGQRLSYLRNEIKQLTTNTLEYYNALTQLNNEQNRGTNI